MKKMKNYLRVMLSVTSVFGFLGGWAIFAHSLKPTQPVSNTSSELAPLPPISPVNINPGTASGNDNGLQFIAPSTSSRSSRPLFMTGGS